MNTKKTCFPRKIGSMSRKVSLLTLLAFALLLSPMVAYGATVTLAWNANTETDLAGYKIYYGTVSRIRSATTIPSSIDVGNITQSIRLTDLDEDDTYYLAATAYDQDNNESAYSVELVHSTGNPNYTNNTMKIPLKRKTCRSRPPACRPQVAGTSGQTGISLIIWTLPPEGPSASR